MATFSVPATPDPNGDSPQAIWQKIKSWLAAGATSVEVVLIDNAAGETQVELHRWNSERTDGSNGSEATAGQNY